MDISEISARENSHVPPISATQISPKKHILYPLTMAARKANSRIRYIVHCKGKRKENVLAV
jgi:hypothetical protein